EFDSIVELSQKLSILRIDEKGENYLIDRKKLTKKYDFHTVRVENTLQVIANEFSLLDTANNIVNSNLKLRKKELQEKVFKALFDKDLKTFEYDYHQYYDEELSKPKNIGAPFFLNNQSWKKEETGILICHG